MRSETATRRVTRAERSLKGDWLGNEPCGIIRGMRPIFVRELTGEERQTLHAGLRSSEVFTLKRCQVLLASARGLSAPKIAELVGCSTQNVHTIVRALETRGLASLRRLSKRPKCTAKVTDVAACERQRARVPSPLRQAELRVDATVCG